MRRFLPRDNLDLKIEILCKRCVRPVGTVYGHVSVCVSKKKLQITELQINPLGLFIRPFLPVHLS